ncbi:EVE domain-containing protein [Candidatus Neptunichlamydia sp. REUL1]|uniref:EVE domain-containing protein n=1 Tax=Candidatus Neptunichlamydia sp. REUL1 TaxID=3064277 RepID=UPI0029316A7F|nr:EVE domain-containing protein [Candidatus Neptunochlamydia sp. REUL1]
MSLLVGPTTRCFVGVVSLEHATRGYNGGFTQACHGKQSPLSRMNKGDVFVQYSPKDALGGSKACQHFTYIGSVATGKVYQVEMGPGFKPFRIDIDYLSADQAKQASIRPLIERLSFIKNKTKWGMAFRFGFLEIPLSDFKIIYMAMTGKSIDTPRKALLAPADSKQKSSESTTGSVGENSSEPFRKKPRLQHKGGYGL